MFLGRSIIFIGIFTFSFGNSENMPECGIISDAINEDRVKWPWHAAIYRRYPVIPFVEGQPRNNLTYHCGGTLVNRNTVLTSAHCVTDKNQNRGPIPSERLRVILAPAGSNFISNADDINSQLFKVENVIIHPKFDADSSDNNVAIIKLQLDATINDYVRPVCFPYNNSAGRDVTRYQVQTGKNGMLAGFGLDSKTGNVSNVLKEFDFSIESDLDCFNDFRQEMKPTQFCAGYSGFIPLINSKGGGLVFPAPQAKLKFYIQGIVCHGVNDDKTQWNFLENKSNIVLAKVSYFSDWIARYMDVSGVDLKKLTKLDLKPYETPVATTIMATSTNTPIISSETTPEPIPTTTSEKPSTTTTGSTSTTTTGSPSTTTTGSPSTTTTENPSTTTEKLTTTTAKSTTPAISTQIATSPSSNTTNATTTTTATISDIITTATNDTLTTIATTTTTERYVATSTPELALSLGNSTAIRQNFGVKCPSIKPTEDANFEVNCVLPTDFESQKRDCETETYVGVRATFDCKPYYKRTISNPFFSKLCLPNGKWSHEKKIFACDLDCGIKTKVAEKFIVNGKSSSTEKWPWYAAIFRKTEGTFQYICGGSLIQTNIIMTACHCVTDENGKSLDPKMYQVVLGAVSSDLAENYEDRRPQVFRVETIIQHPQYNVINADADIALMKLKKDAQITDSVHPVCFPYEDDDNSALTDDMLSPGSFGYVAGFGLDESWQVSQSLKELKIPVVSYRECTKTLGQQYTATQFCAGYTNGSSPCEGDSGGGLYFASDTVPIRFYIQGIVSFGSKSKNGSHCDNNKYTVFTRVASFQSWVAEKLRDTYSDRQARLLLSGRQKHYCIHHFEEEQFKSIQNCIDEYLLNPINVYIDGIHDSVNKINKYSKLLDSL